MDNGTAIANLGGTNPGASTAQVGTVTTQIDTGVGGVTVTIFDTAGAKVDTVTSAANTGQWSSSKTVAGQQYRVEFTGLPLNGFQVGPHGANNGTSTQFVADGANKVNLGLVRASDYYRQNPLLVTSQYSFGPIAGNTSPAIISFPYNSGAAAQTTPAFGNIQAPTDHAIAIPASQVGTTWGIGYNRAQKQAYAAAYTKKHSGIGPGGTGAIYNFALPASDTPGQVTTANVWVNLRGLTTVRDAVTNAVQPAVNTDGAFGAFFTGRQAAGYNWEIDGDNEGWNAVGKSSLGGLDVSDDGSTVYVMNLADNRMYIIPVLPNGAADTANIRSIAVPVPAGVAAGDVRPWAVEFQNGLVYIGLVDSAESDQDRTTLRGYVYAFNPATNNFGASLVNDGSGTGFDLSYGRGASFGGSDNYNAWSPTYNRFFLNQNSDGLFTSQYPQPMLTGLAFDRQGNLTLSIRDRNGDQTGRGTLSNGPETGPALLAGSAPGRVEGVASGELLKAFAAAAPGTFILEAAAANPNNASQVGTDPTSGTGPGGGEFYGEDDFGGAGHRGTSLGGVAQVPGFESVLNTHFDPFRDSGAAGVRSGGVRWFNANSGVLEKSYEIYARDAGAASNVDPNGTFGKANGLGDLVAIEPEDPPIEIGNRVFQDLDRDGVQDPGEPAIQGVLVQLQDSAGAVLATAKTAADGTYYFNSGPGTNSVSEQFAIANFKNGGSYKVVIPNVAGAQQTALTGLVLTTPNATHTGDKVTNDANGDLRNSDFTLTGTSGLAVVNLASNPVGRSNPNIDAGFVTGVNLGNFVWEDTNNNGLFDTGETGIDGVTVNLYQASAPNTILTTQKTATGGAYLFSGLLAGDYIVEVVSPPGFRSSSGGGLGDLVNGAFESGLPAGNSNTNNEDHGKAISGNNLTGYTIRANSVTLTTVDNLNQDFGLVRTFSLGNRVWLDKDNSGKIDAADGLTPGIDGATVKVYSPASFDAAGNLITGKTALRTVTTAGGGFYRFDDLGAGSYVVVVDGATVGGGKSSTGKANAFEPAPGAIPAPGTTDSDDNGTTISGNLIRSGAFVLGPIAGSPTGETDLVTGANPQGTADGQADMTADFGFFRPLFLGNFVWEDANNNGKFEATETKLSGVSVQLLDSTGAPVGATITTDANGNYRFDNLAAGKYTIRVTTPTGFTTSTGKNGSLTGAFEPAPQTNNDNEDHGTLNSTITTAKFVESVVTLGDIGAAGNPDTVLTANDANLRQDFGFFRPLALGDFVFEDKTNNGIFDGADVPVTGVLVELLDSTNSVLTSSTTGADGKYRFDNLTSGSYTVRITPPAGQNFVSSTGANGKTTGPNEPATGITANNADHGTTQSNGTITTTITLLPTGNPDEGGSANLAQDFGLYRPVLLGTLVWSDTNNNGLFDPASGEAGIGGVAVDLLDATGNIVASTTTAADGTYQFPVAPGQYRVRITPPAGRISSTGTGPGNSNNGPYEPSTGKTADNEDKGTTAGTFIQTELITIADPGAVGNPDNAGFANLRQDFGLFTPISLALGNLVFEDANNNGKQDTGEAAIPGANVTLLDATGKSIGTTTTDTNGAYRFENLPPGSYTVQVVAPAGFRNSDGVTPGDNNDNGIIDPTTPNKATSTVTLTDPATTPNPDESGKANLRQDFGFFRPQSIGNLVFVDTNNNGKLDAGEVGKSGVTVTLLQGTTVVGTQTTDANGNYLFPNLLPGTYIVRIAPPAGFVTSTGKVGSPTGPNEPGLTDGTNDADHGTAVGANIEATVTLTAGLTNPDGVDNFRQDFGIFQPIRLGDTIFSDINKNGTLDATETTLANVTVALVDASGNTIATTTTGANGKYQFGNLVPGSYTLRVTPPTGTSLSPVSVDPTANTANQNVGQQKGTFSEATVTLALGGGNQNEGNTDTNTYVFGDFGFVPPPAPVSLGDTVFIDTNKNGKLDTGELPVSGAKVELLDATGATILATQTTGTNGKYLFSNLQSGSYIVRLTPPTGFTLSPVSTAPGQNTGNQNVGTQVGSSIQSPVITLVSGQAPLVEGNTDINNFVIGDFGLVAPPIAKVSGFVYRDPNLDGKFVRGTSPNGDSPIIGATLAIFDSAGVQIATTKTDATGFYQFDNLLPGTYTIRETQPSGLLDGLETPGIGGTTPSNDVIQVTLAANDNNLNNNFGEYAPTSIEGYVWVDVNRNCQFDPATEAGVGGVPITISGTVFAGTAQARPLTAADVPGGSLTVVTDSSGRYVFPSLPPGNYTVSRGDIPANVTGLADWCEQNNDPNGPAPTITNNQFSNVTTNPNVIRASLNFGVVPVGTVVIPGLDPSKRQFLGSSGNTPGAVSPPPTTIPPPGGPNVGAAPLSPSFAVSNTTVASAYTVIGSGVGIAPLVRVMDYASGGEKFRITPFESSFTGGVRVSNGDVNGDGVADFVATTGIGGGPRTRVFDGKTGASIQDYFAFEASFRGGTFVATGDINGDGFADIVVTPEVGGGPRVRTFSGKDGSELNNFFAFDAAQRGGVRVAVADFNGDGKGDIAVVTGAGVPTRVRVFDGTNVSNVLQDFAPYEASFTGGATIAAGDFNGDGRADILVGAEVGGGPRLLAFSGTDRSQILNTFAFEDSFRGGVRVGAQDVNGDGRAEVVAIAGPGGSARVRVINVSTLQDLDTYFAFSPEFTGGAYVG